jgi:hypothetical protein
MTINEKDFKIEYDGINFTLSFLKTKKELKDDDIDTYKLKGYYSILENALAQVFKWRNDPKYPFSEDKSKVYFLQHTKNVRKLHLLSTSLYNSINDLKTHVFNTHKQFLNENSGN